MNCDNSRFSDIQRAWSTCAWCGCEMLKVPNWNREAKLRYSIESSNGCCCIIAQRFLLLYFLLLPFHIRPNQQADEDERFKGLELSVNYRPWLCNFLTFGKPALLQTSKLQISSVADCRIKISSDYICRFGLDTRWRSREPIGSWFNFCNWVTQNSMKLPDHNVTSREEAAVSLRAFRIYFKAHIRYFVDVDKQLLTLENPDAPCERIV